MKLLWLSTLFPLLMGELDALTEQQILEHLYHNLNGDNWLTSWDLTEDPCTYSGVVCANSKVVEIDLSDNNLVGSITPHLYSLQNLQRVYFSKNEINNAGWDRIDELGNDGSIAPLKVLDLTSNRIHSLEGVEHLKATLTELHLTFNNLKSWQDELFALSELQVLAISENEIGGKIDKRLTELANLKELYCYGNELTGTLRE